jgi:hypothetical protein
MCVKDPHSSFSFFSFNNAGLNARIVRYYIPYYASCFHSPLYRHGVYLAFVMFRSSLAIVLLMTVGVLSSNCSGINAISPQCKGSETAYQREYFYINGRYVFNATTNSTLMTWEMYVEKLTPIGGVKQPHPIILMTAGVPSGAVGALVALFSQTSFFHKICN